MISMWQAMLVWMMVALPTKKYKNGANAMSYLVRNSTTTCTKVNLVLKYVFDACEYHNNQNFGWDKTLIMKEVKMAKQRPSNVPKQRSRETPPKLTKAKKSQKNSGESPNVLKIHSI